MKEAAQIPGLPLFLSSRILIHNRAETLDPRRYIHYLRAQANLTLSGPADVTGHRTIPNLPRYRQAKACSDKPFHPLTPFREADKVL